MAESVQERIIRIAKGEVGYREGRSGGHWNNDQKYSKELPGAAWSNKQPYCDTGVHWAAWKAGVLDLWPDVTPSAKAGSASCDTTMAAWKKVGRYSEYPATAAQVFFGIPGDSTHTAFVARWDKTYIWTVEWNTNDTGSREGDGVYAKKHRRRDPNVLGYGYPAYAGGIDSADPAWASGRKPGSPTPAPGGKRFALDWSFDPPAISKLPANVPGVLRYISPGSKKDITKAEVTRLHKAGKWIGLVYESTAGRAGEGRAAGTADAKAAKGEADALGYPGGACIFYAVDFDAEPSKVLPYFRGIAARTKRPVGVYGSKRVVEAVMNAGLAKYGWQTAAWSHHEVASGISFYQHVGKTLRGLGGAWDENSILGPKVPVWLASHQPPPPPPPPLPDETWVVTQANVQQTDDLKTILHRIHVVADGTSDGAAPPDVIVWNELGGKHQAQLHAAVHALPGFESYLDQGVGVSWRTSVFRDMGHDSRVVNRGVLHVTPNRPLLWVDLEHLATGKVYRQKAGHSVHHVEVRGLPRIRGAILGQNRRARRYIAAIAAGFRAAKAAGRPCVFEGDLNVDMLAEKHLPPSKRCRWFPYTVLDAVGRIRMPDHGTHGGRAIDWNVIAGAVYVLASKVLPHGSSDHNPVQHTLSFDRLAR